MSGAILVNHARFMRDIRRDTVEIREIHVGLTRVVTYIRYGMRSGRRYAGWRGESGGGDGVCGEVDRGGDGGDGCGGGGDRKLKVASLIIL